MLRETHLAIVSDWYDAHPINEQQILEKLAQDRVDPEALTEDILQNYDQDHYGGTEANDVLAKLAGIDGTHHVLDVCSGMGGPARYLAQNFGCRVTGLDLTSSRVNSATRLTAMVGLAGLVTFRQGNALSNPFPDESFDRVISQEAFCHVPEKPRLISECIRVLKRGGRMAFTDILARSAISQQSRDRLAREMTQVDLVTLDEYRRLLEDEGCSVARAEDLSETWTEILQARLAMFRGLKTHTVAKFGTDHFRKWDDAYAFFVSLFQSGELGGGRFLAYREQRVRGE